MLADHCELYIEGKAFEQDAEAINRAAANGWKVSAVNGVERYRRRHGQGTEHFVSRRPGGSRIAGVPLLRDLAQSNCSRSDQAADGRRFVYWQYKPGQRMMLLIPVEQWTDRIVLPVEAVVQEGAECYVFQANDDHFDRRPVHVEYRDQEWAVIANDGALKPGDRWPLRPRIKCKWP